MTRLPLPHTQLFPSGLRSARVREVRFVEASAGVSAAGLGLLRGCPGLQAVALACPSAATGTSDALVLRGEALLALAALPTSALWSFA